MDVVILAAGAGRRFGGEKQFLAVAPDGAALLEVTVGDAVRAGCDHAVIVTAPGREGAVRALFEARPRPGCRLSIVSQDPEDLPAPPAAPRTKPWGTAHALWAARHEVAGPFLLFNADDSYGPNAPAALIDALGTGSGIPRGAMLGYRLGPTLSSCGAVSRAVCELDARGMLAALKEYPAIDALGRTGGGKSPVLDPGLPVSMNAWAFPPVIFDVLERYLVDFLAAADLARDECYLPAAVEVGIRAKDLEIAVVPAPDSWCGLTWPGDRERVTGRLADLADMTLAVELFELEAGRTVPRPFGAGLINDTWELGAGKESILLQRLNARVFPDPAAVVRNAVAAAKRLDDALRAEGDEDPRHRIRFRAGRDGEYFQTDGRGGVWRCLHRIPDARPCDPANPAEVRAAAEALGRFPGLVERGRGPVPVETLPGFHDTAARLAALRQACDADRAGRAAGCGPELDRLNGLEKLAHGLAAAGLPSRLVHNDAKLDNVLVDTATRAALCVIDLDTVMPGLAPFDFGDLVRSAVSGLPEDEPDPARIRVRLDTFGNLAAGYLTGARSWLTAPERNLLVDGVLQITYEQALRFLADWLDGDTYYSVKDPEHNLRRSRAQLALLEGLLAQEGELRRIACAV